VLWRLLIDGWILVQQFMSTTTKHGLKLMKNQRKLKRPWWGTIILPKFWEKELLSYTLFLDKNCLSQCVSCSWDKKKKNLVFANLLSIKKFKFVLESDKVITTKSEIFVGKCYSYNNMFKYWWNQYYLCSYDWIYFFFFFCMVD